METVPERYTQAVDAIDRELNRRGHYFWFLCWRLDRMVRRGLIRRGHPIRSIFRSYDGTPSYGRIKKGDKP